MPYYTIKDKDTGSIQDVNLKYEELKSLLKENPNLEQIFLKFPNLGDSVRLGIKKPDNSFRDLLKNVKSKHAHSTIET